MRGRPAVQSTNSLPEQWAWFPLDGEERAVAEQLCDGQETREQLEQRLHVVRPEMNIDQYAGTAIWVPRRDSSDIQASLQVQPVVPNEGEVERCSMAEIRRPFEPEQRPWLTVFSQSIDEVELRAGPAVVIREVTGRNDGSAEPGEEMTMTGSVIYSVFPPGSTDFLDFIFRTPALALVDDLAAEAAWIADTVEITLGERV